MRAVREVRDTAFRAVLAAGASAGEATSVAELVVLGEVLDGTGVRALLDELGDVPHGRVPVERHTDRADTGIDVLRDPAARGTLLLGPSAADHAAVGRRPVFMAGMAWAPALEWVLLSTAARSRLPVLAAQMGADGEHGAAALATPDGALYRGAQAARSARQPPAASALAAAVAHGGGVLLSRCPQEAISAGTAPDRTRARSEARLTEATRSGLPVDPDLWARLYAASRRCLVPESPAVPYRKLPAFPTP
ncbi:hypothetical protein ACFYWS_24780 [Streptomyces sp. NPDC002795]|uniref:hypothetical protein n=1 Tax=Streptomyces sp. NPDC002795 TaxID=3364665 RepID=UPI0036A14188